MNFNYSFTVPESLLVIVLITVAMFFSVCILMFVDIWRELRRQKKQRMNTVNSFSTKKR